MGSRFTNKVHVLIHTYIYTSITLSSLDFKSHSYVNTRTTLAYTRTRNYDRSRTISREKFVVACLLTADVDVDESYRVFWLPQHLTLAHTRHLLLIYFILFFFYFLRWFQFFLAKKEAVDAKVVRKLASLFITTTFILLAIHWINWFILGIL